MSKFRDFILAAEKGAQAIGDTAIGKVFDTIDAAAKKMAAGTTQAAVLQFSSDARMNLLQLVDGVENDAAEVIADGVDEITTILANRAQMLDTPEKFAQFGVTAIAQIQAWIAQKHVGINPAKPTKTS